MKQMNINQTQIYEYVRNFLFKFVNKEFLIFLFFLAISGAFWFVLSVKEPMEREISIPVVLADVPENVILTDETSDTLKVTIRDEGYAFIYYYFNKRSPVVIKFKPDANGEGHTVVTSAELLKLVKARLEKSSQVVSVKPDRMDIYYNNGENKVVPVEINGEFTPDEMSFLTKVEAQPDSVTVYATKDLLKTIQSVKTEYVSMTDISDKAQQKVRLQKVSGMKCVPNVVTVSVSADVSSEGSVEVPVDVVGVPEGKVLRTYPSRVMVKFVSGAKILNMIDPSQFRVEVDYSEIVDNPDLKYLHLRIARKPAIVTNARTAISQVDYLLEQE